MLTTSQISDVLLNEDAVSKNDTGSPRLPPTPPDEREVCLNTINDVLLERVQNVPDKPLVGYPKSSHGLSDYVFYSATDLDRFTSGAVQSFKLSGLPEVRFSLDLYEICANHLFSSTMPRKTKWWPY